jgi:hypothetical protein
MQKFIFDQGVQKGNCKTAYIEDSKELFCFTQQNYMIHN